MSNDNYFDQRGALENIAYNEYNKKQKEMNTNQSTLNKTQKEAQEKFNSAVEKGQEYYNQATQNIPKDLTPESFMDKIIRPVIEVITKYIMENYLTEENISKVSALMESIVEAFFDRLNDIADENQKKNPRISESISKIKSMILKSISREARKTVISENNDIEMKTVGGKRRKRYTKKRRGSKRKY